MARRRATAAGAMAAPLLRHWAGGSPRRRWGTAGATAQPASSTRAGKARACSATQLIKAGLTPAGRGGRAWGRWALGPSKSNSASAAAVNCRAAGVAPAAEIPGTAAVAVAPSTSSSWALPWPRALRAWARQTSPGLEGIKGQQRLQ